ncbi:Polyadenylate-binding protein 4 [Raphanus sativus]|uniref:Polyadenylate-binding protein n=1 Tax=Raphanus sativus TaxID=3726 RepID=A0A6J0JY17_RAPSA|nr:polyadenylate-binding protein 4 [Raphanus sativus]KAJ4890734.1 Polyadenylate-binding protein 4 [Raphanus sativus]
MAQASPPLPPPQVTEGTVAAPDGVNLGSMCSLYIGDLDVSVTDSQLYDYFTEVCPVVSVRVCRDSATNASLGYGYVNYTNIDHAEKAMKALNYTSLNGKMIRVTYSTRDSAARKSGVGNLFVKNLDKSVDNKTLHETFSECGSIASCKVATDHMGQSRGYGFVQFESEDSAKTAIEKLNGRALNGKELFVGPFLKKEERESSAGGDKTKFTNVFVKNLSETTDDDELKTTFGQYGGISSAVVMRDGDGRSRCFGFVNFEDADDAARAVEALNGKKFDDKEWYVGKAQKKSERELELSRRHDEGVRENGNRFDGLNLYVKNLDETVTDEKLRELFAEFGTITSCKVMRDPSGTSKGSGFVAFSATSEASRVLNEMNGKMVSGKPLYVALAQRKEERRAKLQAQFSQMRPAFIPAMSPRMPMFPGVAPGIGQPMFYSQVPPAVIPLNQAGFGYPPPPQMVPGMRPGFFGPMMQQVGPRPGGRRPGDGPIRHHQPQQPMPFMQPQMMMPRGRGHRYPPGRNMPDEGPMPGPFPPYDVNGVPLGQHMPAGTASLASSLAQASPAQQRTMLGEALYPLVDQIEHENAAKVTGMLLEMDQTEVLHLLESPEALNAKVSEALDVLRNVNQPTQVSASPSDLLASLTINDH